MDWKMKMLAGAALFGLAACSSDSSSGADGGSRRDSSGEQLAKYAVSIDETQQTITSYEATCELVDGSAVFNSAGDTSVTLYQFKNDSLCLGEDLEDFEEGYASCLYGDNGGSLFGAWYFAEGDFYSLARAWLNISRSSVEQRVDYSKICYVKEWMELYEEFEVEGITYTDCNHYSRTTEDDEGVEVRLDYTLSISATHSVSTYMISGENSKYNGKSCTATHDDFPITEKLCTVENLQNENVSKNGEYYRSSVYEGDGCDLIYDLDADEYSSVLTKKGASDNSVRKNLLSGNLAGLKIPAKAFFKK